MWMDRMRQSATMATTAHSTAKGQTCPPHPGCEFFQVNLQEKEKNMSEDGKIIVGLQQNTLSKDSTLYIGALEVESSIREKYYYANGYLDIVYGNLDSYNYYATDHLGNVRHVARATPSGVGSIIQANNYYPFGGLLNEGDNQLYVQKKLYNGKEYDRMQGLNLYDYSARQYDPAVCQFTSMDPLCEKYYHLSPYAYCGGNPVKYVDPDGRDAVSIIDEENKIITIKADYYVQTADRVSCIELSGSKVCKGYNADDIKTMNGYSEMLNDMDLKVTEGEYEGYSIRFDLSFIDGGTENDCIEKASNDTFDGVSIGNTFSRWDETHKQFRIKENGDQTGGFTSDNNFILMNKKLDTKMNRMHELFHTFGFEHPGDPTKYKGIMKYPPQRPNTKDANTLIYNPFMSKRRVMK